MSKIKKIRSRDAGDRIIKAARKLFFKHGVVAVSTDMLAKEAKVSKATIYNRFKGKYGILKAVIDSEALKLFDSDMVFPDTLEDYRNIFIQFGINNINLVKDPEVLRFDQLILSQTTKHPEMTTLFFERAYEATYNHVEKMITHGQKHGFIKRTEPAEALSTMLLHSLKDKSYQRALYGIKDSSDDNRESHVFMVLKVILNI